MSNEVTLTTYNDLWTTYISNQVMMDSNDVGGIEALLKYERPGPKSGVVRFPSYQKVTATALGEGSSYANVSSTTSAGTAVCAEIGMVFRASRLAWETSGYNLANEWSKLAANGIAEKVEENICTLFSSMGTVVTSTGCDLTIAMALQSIYKLENEGNLNGGAVFVFPPVFLQHIRYAISASTGTPFAAPSQHAVLGRQTLRQTAGDLFGVPVFVSNNCPATNTSDLSGAILIADGPQGAWGGMAESGQIQAYAGFDQSTSQFAATIARLVGVSEISEPRGVYLVATATAV